MTHPEIQHQLPQVSLAEVMSKTLKATVTRKGLRPGMMIHTLYFLAPVLDKMGGKKLTPTAQETHSLLQPKGQLTESVFSVSIKIGPVSETRQKAKPMSPPFDLHMLL